MSNIRLSNVRLVLLTLLASTWLMLGSALEVEDGGIFTKNLIAMGVIAVLGLIVFFWPTRSAVPRLHRWRS